MSATDGINAPWRMAYLAARQLAADDVVFVGIGAPCLAAMLARRTHAPDITMVFESGVIGADPATPPLSTGSPSVAQGAKMIGSMLDVFAWLQRGGIDIGLLSGAEVDRHGNLNSTVIGPYDAPKLRLPGSGGAHDIATLARKIIILMPHEPKRFVEHVSFITSPGHSRLRQTRSHLGGGPAALVTTRAVFTFEAGEMTLAAHFAGIDAEQALAGIGWAVPRLPHIEIVPLPDQAEIDLANALVEMAA